MQWLSTCLVTMEYQSWAKERDPFELTALGIHAHSPSIMMASDEAQMVGT